jgi:hypothetical protein
MDSLSSQALGDGELIAGRYRITSLLGRGGMGIVHGAIDELTGQRVAIKRTLPDASSKTLELFKREFHTLHGLRHPNIIEVYDYGRDRERWFYTMELLEGGDLGQAAPLPWRKVCTYLRQIATLLGMLHARRLLHRDISPRNIWLLPDGRLKLIDFGALSAFGVPTEVVGTPPLIAPEWLFNRSAAVCVDQRADLYALGALGYWLLTGVHACHALPSADVSRAAARQPRPPSSLAAPEAQREAIPAELDSLILALLRHDAAARPENSEYVIDRIDAILGPASEIAEHAPHSYLRSKAFVGRGSQLQRVDELLRGRGDAAHALIVLGAPGLGRSRFLEELALLGSLSGAASVLVRASGAEHAYGLASALATRLIDRMPEQALAAARKNASVLGQLSHELRERLGAPPPGRALPRSHELQQVLTDWVVTLKSQRNLLILVDDVESSDVESAAWLGVLARQCTGPEMTLVVAVRDAPNERPALPLQLLYRSADTLRLSPLSAAEVELLLHSVFGPAEYLGRTAQAVYAASHGNPAHCLELLESLVDRGLARYSEGSWTLPGLLPEAELPKARSAVQLARLHELSHPARQLAELLSVADVRLTRSDCISLSELSESDTSAALVELVLGGVLGESEQGYAFVHAGVQEHVSDASTTECRTRAHAKLGALLLSTARDPVDALRAGLHLFRAGDRARGEQLTAAAVRYLFAGHPERLQSAIGLMESAVELFRAAGSRDEALAGPLAVLVDASGYIDHRLAARYGMHALATLERVLGLDRVRVLRRYLGGRASLLVALAPAVIAHRAELRELLRMFVHTAAVLHGVATASIDLETTARCANALEPLAVFGPRHVAGFLHTGMLAIGSIATAAHAQALDATLEAAKIADSRVSIRGLPENMRRDAITGSLFAVGVMECWRMSATALEIADRIEEFGPIEAMNADHLRAVYYSLRGERARAAEYRQQFERRALQSSAAWQVVTLGPLDAQFTALWTHDALLAKRAAAELDRLSHELPTLRHEARHARATYLVLCGRYREVVEIMRGSDAPTNSVGWLRGQGILARAHNRLGEHARARELCQLALADRSEADLTFVVLNLHVQLELVLAEAALGELDSARERVKRLLAQHADRVGPLALGAIHEARARVALFERDHEIARLHCTAMRRAYDPTGSATLFELTDQLADQVALAERGERPVRQGVVALLGDDANLITRVHRFRMQGERRWEARARRGLRVALELTGAQDGFVISAAEQGDILYADEREPPVEVLQWAKAVRMSSAEPREPTRPKTMPGCSAELRWKDVCYRMFPLKSPADEADPARLLVLAFEETGSGVLDERMLAIVTGALQETLA